MITKRVREQVTRDFRPHARPEVLLQLTKVGDELSMWRVVKEDDRVEAAALKLAGGELSRLSDALELARYDWRDLLVAAGDA